MPDPEVYTGTKEWCKRVHLHSVHVQMRMHSQNSQGQANNPALIHHLQPGEFPVWFILRKIHENSPDIFPDVLLLPSSQDHCLFMELLEKILTQNRNFQYEFLCTCKNIKLSYTISLLSVF